MVIWPSSTRASVSTQAMPLMFAVVRGDFENAIIGGGDGRAYALLSGGSSSWRDSTVFADGFHGGLRGQFARGVAAHAIHHQKHAARGVDPIAILVVVAQQSGIGGGGGAEFADGHALARGHATIHERERRRPGSAIRKRRVQLSTAPSFARLKRELHHFGDADLRAVGQLFLGAARQAAPVQPGAVAAVIARA